jgi:hypothetical protein
VALKEIAVKKYVVRLSMQERGRLNELIRKDQALRPAADEGPHPVEGGGKSL